MANSSVLTLLVRRGSASSAPYLRGLALVISLVVLAAGLLLPLHILGIVNVLVGSPSITRAMVLVVVTSGIGGSVLLLGWIRLGPDTGIVSPSEKRLSFGAKCVIAVTLLPFIAFLLNDFWSFPTGIDAVAYHINTALKWLQTGSMRVDPSSGWMYALPGNAELPALVALSLGLVNAVGCGNLIAALLLAASVALVAWKLVPGAEPAVLAGIVAITSPTAIFQAAELYVDLFGTAFLLAALALLLWRKKSLALCCLLSGYATGVAVGSKPVFWTYGALFAAAALYVIVRGKGRKWQAAALFSLGVVLSCGFWFLRSTLATGNPVFPMKVAIAGKEIFPGFERTEITPPLFGIATLGGVLLNPWTEAASDNVFPAGPDRSTGVLFAAIAVPGFLFLLVNAFRKRLRPIEVILLCTLLVAFTLWYAVLLRVPRFGLPFIALMCALSAPMLAALLPSYRSWVTVLFIAGLSLNTAFCLAEPLQLFSRRLERHDWSRARYYGYPPMIDNLPPGSRIFDGSHVPWSFILVGSHLSNSVVSWGDFLKADYVVRVGAPNREDAVLHSSGAEIIYNATPPNLFPKIAQPWRIYRVRCPAAPCATPPLR